MTQPVHTSDPGTHLLGAEDALQRGHLTVLVGPEHFTERTGRGRTGDTVDVNAFVLVLFTHRHLDQLLYGFTEEDRRERPEDLDKPSLTFMIHLKSKDIKYLVLRVFKKSAECYSD